MLKLIFCSDFICLKLFLCLEHFQGQLVYSDQIDFESGNSFPPKPNLMILTKTDSVNPSPLNAPVNWSNKHEICIGRFKLPEETLFGKESCEEKVQLFIQLNPYLRELKSFLADVHTEEFDKFKEKYIGPIVISLKTDLACSQEGKLLELTTAEERNAAFNLVMKKEISQLTTGIGPHKDTVLSVLCAQRDPAKAGQTFAQIHAVVQSLVKHSDPRVQQTVFKQNNNQISAFEIAAITNNHTAACYLAEVMYNLSADTRTALRILNCRDTQGNTIIHLLARKGDSNYLTLKSLLEMKLTDGTKVFSILSNSKKQFPMHIATQNVQNQPETMKLLYEAMPRSFDVVDDDGMTALHYACQRTTDVNLVSTVLSYKKDNINTQNHDGFTPLDLIILRTHQTVQTKSLFAIEKQLKEDIVQLLRNNGAKRRAENSFPIVSASASYYSSAQNLSPTGSPYSCSQESPNSYCSNSYFTQPSPGSVNVESPSYYQGSPYNNPESPVQQSSNNEMSYEDQIASQILNHFPEISSVLDVLDENSQ